MPETTDPKMTDALADNLHAITESGDPAVMRIAIIALYEQANEIARCPSHEREFQLTHLARRIEGIRGHLG